VVASPEGQWHAPAVAAARVGAGHVVLQGLLAAPGAAGTDTERVNVMPQATYDIAPIHLLLLEVLSGAERVLDAAGMLG